MNRARHSLQLVKTKTIQIEAQTKPKTRNTKKTRHIIMKLTKTSQKKKLRKKKILNKGITQVIRQWRDIFKVPKVKQN